MAPADPIALRMSSAHVAVAVRATGPGDLARAVAALGLGPPRPVVAVVGGADGADDDDRVAEVVAGLLVPGIRAHRAIAVDGGTDSGVMRLLGRARAGGAPFPLVGVAAEETVRFPGHAGSHPDAAPLEVHHTHFVLVPGDRWGDESDYLVHTVSALAGSLPSVTVLVNGGDITLADAARSVAAGRPVLVLGGSGRVADRLAAAAADPAGCGDPRLAAMARSSLVRILDVTDPAAVRHALAAVLGR